MSVICHIDDSEHESIADVHALLRSLRIKQETYYHQYAPRRDLATGELIPYKDYKQYFSQDFKDKNSLKKWIKANPEEGRKWAIEWLRKRKKEKGLVYAPSQAELRSLCCPSMPYYDSVGGYYAICHELGFIDRYVSYTEQKTVKAGYWDGKCIVCDSREQLPLILPVKTVKDTVNVGDYALAAPHDLGLRIERKGLSDFVGTLNCRKVTRKKKGDDSSFERFDRELQRAVESDLYVVMLVESTITQALSFNYLPQMKWSKVSPQHVFHNLRELLTKYPLHFQVVFADGRPEASRLTLRIFEMGEKVRRVDLESALERGIL